MTCTNVNLIHVGQYNAREKKCPGTMDYKTTKLKSGDIMVKIRGGLTALVWKDGREVYMLSNIDPPHQQKEINVTTATTPETSYCGKEQLKNELQRQF